MDPRDNAATGSGSSRIVIGILHSRIANTTSTVVHMRTSNRSLPVGMAMGGCIRRGGTGHCLDVIPAFLSFKAADSFTSVCVRSRGKPASFGLCAANGLGR